MPINPGRIVKIALILTVCCLAFAACSGPSATISVDDDDATSIIRGDETPAPTASPVMTPTSTLAPTVTPTPTSTPSPTPTLEPTATLAASFDATELQRRIDEILVGRQGFYAVTISTVDGNRIYDLNADIVLDAASLYKLAIMVEVFRQRDLGVLSLGEAIFMEPGYFQEVDEFDAIDLSYVGTSVDVRTLLRAMITTSSNSAAWALLARVGTDNVNATMQSLGLVTTEIRWSPDPSQPAPEVPQTAPPTPEPAPPLFPLEPTPENVEPTPTFDTSRAEQAFHVTSAGDMDRLFLKLLRGDVISTEASFEMLALLTQQQINNLLPALLPEGAIVAHKTGKLPGILHDAGIIYTKQGPVVVSVLSDSVSEGEAVQVIAAIGELIYNMGL